MKGPYEDLILAWNSQQDIRNDRIRSMIRNRRGIDIEATRTIRNAGGWTVKLKSGYVWNFGFDNGDKYESSI